MRVDLQVPRSTIRKRVKAAAASIAFASAHAHHRGHKSGLGQCEGQTRGKLGSHRAYELMAQMMGASEQQPDAPVRAISANAQP